MTLFGLDQLGNLRRWLISAVVVLAAHGGIAAAIGWHRGADEEFVFPFDFENPGELGAPPEEISELPPGPQQVQSEASEARPSESLEERPQELREAKQVDEELKEVPPAPDPEVPVEQVQEVKQEIPRAQEAMLPAPATTAPVPVPDRVATVASAPVLAWRGLVSGLLERNKRYPETSRSRGEQGVVGLSFTVDRKGQLVSSKIVKSSGFPALDEEAIAMVQRAQPFPPPPKEMTADQVILPVPVRFYLK